MLSTHAAFVLKSFFPGEKAKWSEMSKVKEELPFTPPSQDLEWLVWCASAKRQLVLGFQVAQLKPCT